MHLLHDRYSRRKALSLLLATSSLIVAGPLLLRHARAAETDDDELLKRFEFLSQNGNSNCSAAFLASIATMPAGAHLQGSCCAEMDAHRYVEQIKALRKFSYIAEIPDDPYDIRAEVAQKALPFYELHLDTRETAIFDYAMANSDERGPCCCECWRWHVYGGLGKFLIRERGFDGPQLMEVWNLSNGCGGSG